MCCASWHLSYCNSHPLGLLVTPRPLLSKNYFRLYMQSCLQENRIIAKFPSVLYWIMILWIGIVVFQCVLIFTTPFSDHKLPYGFVLSFFLGILIWNSLYWIHLAFTLKTHSFRRFPSTHPPNSPMYWKYSRMNHERRLKFSLVDLLYTTMVTYADRC